MTTALRVGIIEDHADNAELLTTLLEEDLGAEVCICCSNGSGFFSWLAAKNRSSQRAPLDLLLIDLRLSGESGYSILERVRRLPAMEHTRLVAITANVMANDLNTSYTAGFDGFIGKPINLGRFPQLIRQIMAGEAVWESR
jgi:CheY-like chemotaxis protein